MSLASAQTKINKITGLTSQDKRVLSESLRELVGLQGLIVADDAITNAVVAHNINSTFSDTEVEATLNALGVKINAIISALETLGLIET